MPFKMQIKNRQVNPFNFSKPRARFDYPDSTVSPLCRSSAAHSTDAIVKRDLSERDELDLERAREER
jgi:hypothetical protein